MSYEDLLKEMKANALAVEELLTKLGGQSSLLLKRLSTDLKENGLEPDFDGLYDLLEALLNENDFSFDWSINGELLDTDPLEIYEDELSVDYVETTSSFVIYVTFDKGSGERGTICFYISEAFREASEE